MADAALATQGYSCLRSETTRWHLSSVLLIAIPGGFLFGFILMIFATGHTPNCTPPHNQPELLPYINDACSSANLYSNQPGTQIAQHVEDRLPKADLKFGPTKLAGWWLMLALAILGGGSKIFAALCNYTMPVVFLNDLAKLQYNSAKERESEEDSIVQDIVDYATDCATDVQNKFFRIDISRIIVEATCLLLANACVSAATDVSIYSFAISATLEARFSSTFGLPQLLKDRYPSAGLVCDYKLLAHISNEHDHTTTCSSPVIQTLGLCAWIYGIVSICVLLLACILVIAEIIRFMTWRRFARKYFGNRLMIPRQVSYDIAYICWSLPKRFGKRVLKKIVDVSLGIKDPNTLELGIIKGKKTRFHSRVLTRSP